ncbi:VanZ family protein [Brevibacillus laterosporus]|uniref:Putative integral membrane protein n=1 Tax=Brevibacillus laterosporus LMG 15441 TaxID=1042163 RepID=A0A075R3E9_BRELA|nr:VanZ family protein [Brevibacillus laterosporus]AIG26374.1 putative integral membrane protein [Brevibacillus laterosporus LMG 15441]AUM64946.1 VanZ family protein [Brevibacillus laterosporus]ERM18785.1 teicoplanin resistance protein VanZ [Brevibacillus laterosporus PE36]MCR8997403.1 VanZ family protein [Brevibacillus laterosporus]RJL08345.1 VanZ family protein [Brevibacillus laterosporus]
MGAYLVPIQTALFIFLLVAFVLTVPYMIFSYRRYGYINRYRVLFLSSFLFYALCAYFLVILPLPDIIDTCSMQSPGTVYYNLQPFSFVQDFLKETNLVWSKPATYLSALRERAFLQAAFNFLLLLPLGVYVRYFFKKGWKFALGVGFATSLFFEITQLTALYGFYTCPYRLFDIDDLMLNTSGAVAGFFIAPFLLIMFPPKDQLDQGINLDEKPVGYIHRLLAFMIDSLIVEKLTSVFTDLFVRNTPSTNWGVTTFQYPIITIACFILYFIGMTYLCKGQTVGLWLLRLRVVSTAHQELTIKEIAKRNISFYIGNIGITSIGYFILNGLPTTLSYYPLLYIMIFGVVFLYQSVLVLHFVLIILRRKRQFYYETISQTRIARKIKEPKTTD